MSIPRCIDIDAETWRIEGRPVYPPRPIGWSIKWPGQKSHYYAFGHASDNNCTEAEAKEALLAALNSDEFLCFHGGKFDIEVLCKWLGIALRDPRLHWTRIHDTSFLAFLCDPHARSHGLKELATQHLNWPADERDALAVWAWDNRLKLDHTVLTSHPTWRNEKDTGPLKVKRSSVKTAAGLTKSSNPFDYYPYAPGTLVGEYAEGDTDRQNALFAMMYEYVVQWGMLEAYDRERELMPILLENEQQGIFVDLPLLEQEHELYTKAFEHVEHALRVRLNAPDLNFDADQDFARALIRAGEVREEQFERTPAKKEYKVGKDSLKPEMFADPLVASAIGYRNRLKTCLTMFMGPWLKQAQVSGGIITTNWNQTRGVDGGTRTGRPSCNDHNFLNISKSFEDRPDGYIHPDFLGVPHLPLVRKFVMPDPGELWLHRDFSGQELRVFADFEGDQWQAHEFEKSLLAAYLRDPAIDPHAWVRDQLQGKVARFQPAPGISQDQLDKFNGHLRTQVKVTNFRKIYGGGAGAVAQALGLSMPDAKQFCADHDQALPGRKLLDDWCKSKARFGEPIRTWGGRIYFVEEPAFVDGRLMNFEYKLINYLVQGSAADITKQAIIDWYNNPYRLSRFLVTVYDEINVSSPIGVAKDQMRILREEMCTQRLKRCPMLSDGKVGDRWGAVVKEEKYEPWMEKAA